MVRAAIEGGEIVEDYSAEMLVPGRLILGFQGKRPCHVVVSENPETQEITIITVYIPDSDKWKKALKRRRG
jgi:hypothetical protein